MLGETCEYCTTLNIAAWGDKDLKTKYALNCVDTIRYENHSNSNKLICVKSKVFCKNGPCTYFIMDNKNLPKYSFSFIYSNYEDIMKGYDNFPEIKINIDSLLFIATDEMPQYQGGENALSKLLGDNIKYPPTARDFHVQCTVYLTFIVDKQGNIRNIKVLKGVEKTLDNEALRVANLLSKWKPGKYIGIPVNVRFIMPIRFTVN
jgi:TonB family protein